MKYRIVGPPTGSAYAIAALLALGGIAVHASLRRAEAYDLLPFSWDHDPSLRISSISFPSSSVWRTDLLNAIGRWNSIAGMSREFDHSFSGASSFTEGDGHNDVAFVDAGDVDGGWGLTASLHDGDETEETDIMFNADITWRSGAQDERVRNESHPAFRKVAVHELGHSLGLDHSCSELAQMAQGFTGHVWYGGNANLRHHPMPDDVQGARAQNPTSSHETDIALTNFLMDGSCGSRIWRDNADVTVVMAGDPVNVSYGVANLGNVAASFSSAVYLSTNAAIEATDTYLGGVAYYLNKHVMTERASTYRIPCAVPPGTYYIGALADATNTLSEQRESNNSLIFPGRWRVTPPRVGPDLVVESTSLSPLHPSVKDSITFSAIVRNVGCDSSGSQTTLAFRVGGETTAASYVVPVLAPFQGYTVHRRVRLAVAQNYINTLTIDPSNGIAEANEANNIRTQSYSVH